MKLNLAEIKSITFGAVDIEETQGSIEFNRFSKKQIDCYKVYRKERGPAVIDKTFHTSGVRFSFLTTSTKLKIEYLIEFTSCRDYANFDVLEDGKLIANFGIKGLKEFGKLQSFEVKLSDREKHIEVYFPWSVRTKIVSVELDDFSLVIPKKREKIMIAHGDSITQGYEATEPSNTLANRLARHFNCDIYNKAVGGDTFFPELLDVRDSIVPDVVIIGYGTNDCFLLDRKTLTKNCKEFLEKAFERYKNSKIYVATPIWRSEEIPCLEMTLQEVDALIKEVAKGHKNAQVLTGFDLVPHSADYFAPDVLHPNDKGFEEYYNNYIKKL